MTIQLTSRINVGMEITACVQNSRHNVVFSLVIVYSTSLVRLQVSLEKWIEIEQEQLWEKETNASVTLKYLNWLSLEEDCSLSSTHTNYFILPGECQ